MTLDTRFKILSGPKWLKENARCRRKFTTRECRVVKLDKTKSRALIQDKHHSCWISFLTLATEWEAACPTPT